MNTSTYPEIAESFELWGAYADPNGLYTREAFEAMTVEERIQFQIVCFGPEKTAARRERSFTPQNAAAILSSRLRLSGSQVRAPLNNSSAVKTEQISRSITLRKTRKMSHR